MTDNSDDIFSHTRKRIRKLFQNLYTGVRDFFDDHAGYKQMRLPVDKITKEFEDSLIDNIEHKFIHADVRVAKREDIDRIVTLYDKAWHSSPMPIREVGKEKFLKIFDDPHTTFLIAKVDDVDGGFILLDTASDKNQIGIIAGLGILPEYQHQGLGTILGMASWNYFKERGVKELRCEVYKDNKLAYSFIKNLGFEEYHKADSIPGFK
ncbi:MAG: GNAT family N-acetyltransferase [Candidatus Hermodarchaeota archaeon]